MSKLLKLPDGAHRVIAPTTTGKLARRILSASAEIAHAMPRGFYAVTPLDILLRLHIAEDDARYLELRDLTVPSSLSVRVVESWVDALKSEGLIDRQGDLLALSQSGYDLVVSMIESIYASQRALD